MRSELKFDTICASMVTEQIQQSTYLNCEPNVAVLKSAKKTVTTYQFDKANYKNKSICII